MEINKQIDAAPRVPVPDARHSASGSGQQVHILKDRGLRHTSDGEVRLPEDLHRGGLRANLRVATVTSFQRAHVGGYIRPLSTPMRHLVGDEHGFLHLHEFSRN